MKNDAGTSVEYLLKAAVEGDADAQNQLAGIDYD